MNDAQFGVLMVLVGGIVTAIFTYLGVQVKERISSSGSIAVAEISSKDAFIGRLMTRLQAVEASVVECEKRCSEQTQTIMTQSQALGNLSREREVDKAELESCQKQLAALRGVNRRLEARISEMERRL
jgi:chromosome segregation ATPase